jgi:hypothetical protein
VFELLGLFFLVHSCLTGDDVNRIADVALSALDP